MKCDRSPYKKGRHLYNAGGQCQWCKAYRATSEQLREGADRERRRIRRAQTPLIKELLSFTDGDNDYGAELAHKLDAATRAPKRRGQREDGRG